MRLRSCTSVAALLLLGCDSGSAATEHMLATVEVAPSGETDPIGGHGADDADDPAIWSASEGDTAVLAGRQVRGFVAGTGKKSGLYIYGMDGRQLQFLPEHRLNNVDLREVRIRGRNYVVLGASDRGRNGIALYIFDPLSRSRGNAVRYLGFFGSDLNEPYGFCMGSGNDHLLAVLIGKSGRMRMYRVQIGTAGIRGAEIARFDLGGKSEGCVVDDAGRALYIVEERRGLWKYSLDDISNRELVQRVGTGVLKADVEGVAVLRDGDRRYLLVSSQGDSSFGVWRVDTPHPLYSGRFSVGRSGTIDQVTGTDGVAAAGGHVGPFEDGLVVVQDDQNDGGTQNFKMVDWKSIRTALRL